MGKHKLNTIDPKEIIAFIEKEYPDLKGVCYYEDKQLKSKDPAIIFDFDPIHQVVNVYKYGLPHTQWTEIKVNDR